MSSEVAVRVESVGKAFAIYDRPSHRLLEMLLPRGSKAWHRDFHALRDVSFEVHRGETVGIVGRNGSGKSTLLQIICGTLAPSSGRVQVNGRIAALLELGAGFNPEFTGRENVYLNGTVLGLTRAQIDERFDSIAAFADIGEFIEQPVKSYSSGMYVRLAFAVAISVEPDILVVDEALSVGDEAFQRKCFARISRLRDDGATVLFVSHGASTVTELCDRAVLLDHGQLLCAGGPRFVLSRYHKLLFAPAGMVAEVRERILAESQSGAAAQAPAAGVLEGDVAAGQIADTGSESCFDPGLVPQSTVTYPPRGARIDDPHLETAGGRRVNVLRAGEEFDYVYEVYFETFSTRVRFGMLIRSITGVDIGGAVSSTVDDPLESVEPGSSITARFRFRCLLAPGTYFLNAGVVGNGGEGEYFLDRRVDVAMFRVLPDPGRLATGLVDLDVQPRFDFNPSQVPA